MSFMYNSFLNAFNNHTEMRYDISIPAIGATTIKIAVAITIPMFIASMPYAARKAPAKPPISV
jgi:hypothetical protein